MGLFGVALVATVGVGALGVALANALENAREFPQQEAFALQHGLTFTRGGVARPFRFAGRRREREVAITRVVETRDDRVWRGHLIQVELPARLPDRLRVRSREFNPQRIQLGTLDMACPDAGAWRQLQEQRAVMVWMVGAFREMPKVRIEGSTLELETQLPLPQTIQIVDRMLGVGDRLASALTWRPFIDGARPLPPLPPSSLGVQPPPPRAEEAVDVPVVGGQMASMLAELQAGATLESRGQFTLDAGRALERLRNARLERKTAYVFDLIRAGVARGATLIEVDGALGELRARFDGPPYDPDELQRAAGAIFVSGEDALAWSVRHLALGLQGALGTSPRRVRVESGGHWVEMTGAEEEVTVGRLPRPVERTEVRVRPTLLGFVGGGSMHPLLTASYRQLVSNTVVVLGGRRRSVAPIDLVPFGRTLVSAPGIVGLVGFDMDHPGEGSRAMVGQHAVMLDTPPMPRVVDGYRAVFMLDDPETDLTGLRLVQGQQWAELLWLAETSIPRAFASLGKELSRPIPAATPLHGLRIERARQFVRRHLHGFPSRSHVEASPLAPLISAQVWPLVDGGHASSRDLFARADHTGAVRFQNARLPGIPPLPGALDAPRLDPSDRSLLLAWFGAKLSPVE